jgi:hypothetical protein
MVSSTQDVGEGIIVANVDRPAEAGFARGAGLHALGVQMLIPDV